MERLFEYAEGESVPVAGIVKVIGRDMSGEDKNVSVIVLELRPMVERDNKELEIAFGERL